jgi:hypothetical protein
MAERDSFYKTPKYKEYMLKNDTGAPIDIYFSRTERNHQGFFVVTGRDHSTLESGHQSPFTYQFSDMREARSFACREDRKGDVICSNGEGHPAMALFKTRQGLCRVIEKNPSGVIQCNMY